MTGGFETILRALSQGGVEFVVIGGVAALLQGAPVTTFDLDIVHAREETNCARLHRVLEELGACLREHLPRRLTVTAEDLRGGGHALLSTRAGPLDVLGTVVGGLGFEVLVERAVPFDLGGGLRVQVLELSEIIRLKEELGREKDAAQLPILRRTLDEVRRHEAE